MRRFVIIFQLICFSCNHKPTINNDQLAKELDSIMAVDQEYRAQMQSVQQEHGWNSDEMSGLWEKQKKADGSNLNRIRDVIELVGGYPGKSLVGLSASKTAFYVLQHAPDSIQEQYYELIIEAARANELDKALAAMYQDRYLMHRGQPQIFGTQVRVEFETDPLTQERTERAFIWPIADTIKIDSIRMSNGLRPLEEYVSNFGLSRWE